MVANEEPASPQEQQQYDAFVKGIYRTLYGRPDVAQQTAQALLDPEEDPVDALAELAATTVDAAAQSAVRKNNRIPVDIQFAALEEIVENLAAFVEQISGEQRYDQDALSAAFLRAAGMLGDLKVQSGELSREEAQQELMRLREADERGELATEAPDLAALAEMYRSMGIDPLRAVQQPAGGDQAPRQGGAASGPEAGGGMIGA